jgi:DMSO/TMAO reductase YedYZ heme-binding membrane subunit
MHLYFVAQPGHPNVAGLRTDTFGFANDTGLLAALLLVVLALISSDYALRLLGTTRWRTIQRSAYFIAAFTIVHAAGYQWIEKPRWWRVGLVVVAAAGLLGVQLAGRRRHRRAARP